jgi:hypothetical protein
VVHLVGPSQGSRALVGLSSSNRTMHRRQQLMGVELGLPTKPRSAGSSSLSSVIGALDDPLELVLGQGAQERDDATANRRGQVKVGFVQYLDQSAALVDALDQRNKAAGARTGSPIRFDVGFRTISSPEWMAFDASDPQAEVQAPTINSLVFCGTARRRWPNRGRQSPAVTQR